LAAKHLEAGARRVVVSAPSHGADFTVILGVNEHERDPEYHQIISNAYEAYFWLRQAYRYLVFAGVTLGFFFMRSRADSRV
jgi:hypothetical protein